MTAARIGPSGGDGWERGLAFRGIGTPLRDCCECSGTGEIAALDDVHDIQIVIPCICLEYQKEPGDCCIFGHVLCPHYGAVALWVGTSGRRLMGFSIEHIDRVEAALDEMTRIDEELGLY